MPSCFFRSGFRCQCGSHMQTLIIYKLGFNQNRFTFTLLLLINIVLRVKIPGTNFINHVFRYEILQDSPGRSQPGSGREGSGTSSPKSQPLVYSRKVWNSEDRRVCQGSGCNLPKFDTFYGKLTHSTKQQYMGSCPIAPLPRQN